MLTFVQSVGVVDHFYGPSLFPNFNNGLFDADIWRDIDIASMHERPGFILQVRRRRPSMTVAFRHDRNLHLIRELEHLLSEVEFGPPAPPPGRDSIEKNLGDIIRPRIVDQNLRSVLTMNDLGVNVKVFSKTDVP